MDLTVSEIHFDGLTLNTKELTSLLFHRKVRALSEREFLELTRRYDATVPSEWAKKAFTDVRLGASMEEYTHAAQNSARAYSHRMQCKNRIFDPFKRTIIMRGILDAESGSTDPMVKGPNQMPSSMD